MQMIRLAFAVIAICGVHVEWNNISILKTAETNKSNALTMN